MAEIKPFQGTVYNPEKIGDIAPLVAPPYDVISPSEKEFYIHKHPHNVIHLTLGGSLTRKHQKEDYREAAETLHLWLGERILVREDLPGIYLYKQEFFHKGRRIGRRGFISLVRLEDYQKKIILPHERTLKAPREDRLNLLRSCRAHLSPVFFLYPDEEKEVERVLDRTFTSRPRWDFLDDKGIRNRIWFIPEDTVTHRVQEIMREKRLYIADGHHRYETALTYLRERENSPSYSPHAPYNFIMGYMVNMEDEGLVILPAHRVFKNLSQDKFHSLLSGVKGFFQIKEYNAPRWSEEQKIKSLLEALAKRRKEHAFGMVTSEGKYFLLVLKDSRTVDNLVGGNHSREWKNLDVVILHYLILDRILGLKGKDLEEEHGLTYITDEEKAIETVRGGKWRLAFLLNPTPVSQIQTISEKGEKMPGKATYFYPKPLTGLVFHVW